MNAESSIAPQMAAPSPSALPLADGHSLELLQSANSLPVLRVRVSHYANPSTPPPPPVASPQSSCMADESRRAVAAANTQGGSAQFLRVHRFGSPSLPPSHSSPLPPPTPAFRRCFFHPQPLNRSSSASLTGGQRSNSKDGRVKGRCDGRSSLTGENSRIR